MICGPADTIAEGCPLTGIMGIAEDPDGNLWLASPGIGLLRLNRERNRFLHYGYQPQDLHSIAENKVIALLQDRDGNIWTGLHSAGVNYFRRGSQRFEVFRNIPGDPNSLTLDFGPGPARNLHPVRDMSPRSVIPRFRRTQWRQG
jgi:ligand-binding sensor domain-containing protein